MAIAAASVLGSTGDRRHSIPKPEQLRRLDQLREVPYMEPYNMQPPLTTISRTNPKSPPKFPKSRHQSLLPGAWESIWICLSTREADGFKAGDTEGLVLRMFTDAGKWDYPFTVKPIFT
jgi:hypothetical protein